MGRRGQYKTTHNVRKGVTGHIEMASIRGYKVGPTVVVKYY